MKRKFGRTATRRLQVESLEHRRLLAVAAFETELYSDNGGVPGQLLADNTVVAGETFFLRVTAEEFDPFLYGLRTASLDIDWDAALLDVVEADWDLDSVITADLPLFHSGTLDNAAGRIDELSGTAMLSGGAGRSIGNMHSETFAMIRMQAGDEPGTASIALSKSETKTITVPSMILQDEQLRFEAATVTIVAASPPAVSEVIPPVDSPAAPPLTDSAELSAPADIVEVVEPPEVPVISEPDPEPLPPSPVVSEPEPMEDAPVTLDFDANQDGVFDFADFGLLNIQVVTAQQGPVEPVEPLAAESAELSPVDTAGELIEEMPAAESTDEYRHVCIAVRPGDVVAAETWVDALAQAWLADAEARRHRRGIL
ncbi:hypothetical protein [Roseimaritima ulvae]|uniref:Uncharacterized protein n=1 Tax=Roseimaritima ulvae TaxID=980254 RepID=A0A5B9QTA0_9BACT|nr:hypothetical protein [Roseimaritima ulvae]QEG42244.1 hypothetical protein UC8_42780 [Roseimaritima ulvae]